jgi:hypothetical protein
MIGRFPAVERPDPEGLLVATMQPQPEEPAMASSVDRSATYTPISPSPVMPPKLLLSVGGGTIRA